jgi:hypothetical protein
MSLSILGLKIKIRKAPIARATNEIPINRSGSTFFSRILSNKNLDIADYYSLTKNKLTLAIANEASIAFNKTS